MSSPKSEDMVSNLPLRAAFMLSPFTASDLASMLEWRNGKHWDSSRVLRRLGLTRSLSRGVHRYQEHVHYEVAVKMALAMGLDPVDVDL